MPRILRSTALKNAENKVSCYDGAYSLCDTLREYLRFAEQKRVHCKATMSSKEYQSALEAINRSITKVLRRDIIGNYLSWECAPNNR